MENNVELGCFLQMARDVLMAGTTGLMTMVVPPVDLLE